MIRINLLQLKRKKKAKPLPAFIVLMVLMLAVALLAVFFVYMAQTKKIDRLEANKKASQKKLAELKEKIKEVDDFEAKIKEFERRKGVIVELRKAQGVPVKVMNELSFRLADGVWFKDMDIQSNAIKLTGYAFTNSNVVEFVNNLKASSMFSNVFLAETKEDSIDKVNVYQFKLSFSYTI